MWVEQWNAFVLEWPVNDLNYSNHEYWWSDRDSVGPRGQFIVTATICCASLMASVLQRATSSLPRPPGGNHLYDQFCCIYYAIGVDVVDLKGQLCEEARCREPSTISSLWHRLHHRLISYVSSFFICFIVKYALYTVICQQRLWSRVLHHDAATREHQCGFGRSFSRVICMHVVILLHKGQFWP